MPQHKPDYVHTWDYCGHCQCPTVICGKCGKNTCSGGYGDEPNSATERVARGLGPPCSACPSAYEFEDNNAPPVFSEEYKAECIKETKEFFASLGL